MPRAEPSPTGAWHGIDGDRLVAIAEAAKGLVVLLAGFGLLAFFRHDVQHVAEEIVRHLHLDAAGRYPAIFIAAAARLDDMRLVKLAGITMAYVLLRFVEAYGLWLRRRWAQWLAALSGGIYLPVELYELAHRPTVVKAAILAVNAAVVAYMAYALATGRAHRRGLGQLT
ncbi:MAG: DUF2127 domain-containing protein [Proteobacteria bacterium]|nr:DUF2127 domain-containing protein [Pseudomonadota bacterium]